MADAVVLKTKKVFNNKLLQRRQMIVEVHHGAKSAVSRKEIKVSSKGRAVVSSAGCKASLLFRVSLSLLAQAKLAQLYKVKDPNSIVVYGMETRFGGGISDGFAFIYQSAEALVRFEPGFRRKKNGHDFVSPHAGTTRKQRKEKKNKRKIVIGTAARAAKRAARKKE
jgi:small subunit ribosomal protein S24e